MDTLNPNLLDQKPRRHARRFWLLGTIGAVALWQGVASSYTPPRPTSFDTLSPLALVVRVGRIVSGAEPIFGDRDRLNVLLLGMGGAGHDGPYLTDTMILVSFKPSTKQVAFLSIPRDLLTDVPGIGRIKINAANALAEANKRGTGGDVARVTVAEAFGVSVPYYVRIDFSGFEKLIDDLGGVTVNVERGFTDEQFPAGENLYETVSFTRGQQQMDGSTALRFARSRHGGNGEGSDFARGRRQQKVLLALADKIFSIETLANHNKLKSLAEALSKHLATNIDARTLVKFWEMGRAFNPSTAKHAVLDDSPNGALVPGTGDDGAWVLLPADGTGENLKAIARNIFADTPTISVAASKPIRVEVQNGTTVAGLAYQTSVVIRQKGLSVVSYGNAARRDYQRTVIYDYTGGAHAKELRDLASLLNAEITTTIPTWLPNASGTASAQRGTVVDFLIIIGKSE